MRLLQITNSLMSGGAEKLVVDTSILFKKKGIDVEVLLLDGTSTPFLEKLSTHNDIPIHSLGDTKNIYNPLNIFKLKKYLNSYDIVHVHLFPSLYWVSFCKLLGLSSTRVLVTEHNTTNRRRSIPIFRLLDKVVYKQFEKIITISNAVDENLKNHLGVKFTNLIKVYNGINLEVIEKANPYAKQELGYSEQDVLLLQVASFTPQKDQKTLIKAVTNLPDHYKLLLVGDGPTKQEHIDLSIEIGGKNQIHFLGIRSDVPRLLKSVDVVILSSFYEGLSLSSVEGLASGKPFIASNAPGLSEVVEGAGILFETQNVAELTSKLKEVTENKVYSESITTSCLERSKKFDIHLMVDSYMKLYKQQDFLD